MSATPSRLAWIGMAAALAAASWAAGTAHAQVRLRGPATHPATFIGIAAAPGSRIAVFSARDGRRLKFLTTPQPGGGVSQLALSANGRTVAFQRAPGTCAADISTIPAAGGKERALIPLTGRTLPGDPSYSADGRYLLYSTSRCLAPFRPLVHLRNLRTGHELRKSAAGWYVTITGIPRT